MCQGPCCKGVRHVECKWCHLPKNTVNRLSHAKSVHLPWRRPRGLECSVCPFVIASKPRWANADKDEMLKWCTAQGEEYKNFMDDRKAWEDKKNIDPKSRESGMRQPGAKAAVIARNTDMMQTSEKLGNLWPTQLYIKHKGKKPARKDIMKIMHQGRAVSGVVLDDSHGAPVGVIALSSISQQAAERLTTVKDSENCIDDKEIEDAFKAASDRQRVAAKQGKNKDGTFKDAVVVRSAFDKKKAGDDDSSEGDAAVLDSIWKRPMVSKQRKGKVVMEAADDDDDKDRSDDEQGEDRPRKKAKKTPPTDTATDGDTITTQRPRTKRSADSTEPKGAAGAASAGKRAATGADAKKSSKDLDISEQIVLQAKQLTNNLADDDMVTTITLQKFDDLATKLDSRLTDSLQTIYSANYTPGGEETRGMRMAGQEPITLAGPIPPWDLAPYLLCL